MTKENKNLKKLTKSEMQSVSGGKIFFSSTNPKGDADVWLVAVPQEAQVYRCSKLKEAVLCARYHGVDDWMKAYPTPQEAFDAAWAYANANNLWHTTNMNGFLAHFS